MNGRAKLKVMEPDEITEWQWFDLNDLPSPRYFPSFEVIENFKKENSTLRENRKNRGSM
jgi:hypothetical protein